MSKFAALLEDEDDIFLGSPKNRFFDAVFNANNGVVRAELEEIEADAKNTYIFYMGAILSKSE